MELACGWTSSGFNKKVWPVVRSWMATPMTPSRCTSMSRISASSLPQRTASLSFGGAARTTPATIRIATRQHRYICSRMGVSLAQLDQSGVGRRKSTPVEVKSSEVTLEINMQPFASCLPGFRHTDTEHLRREPSMAARLGDDRVQNERVRGSVPRNIDKPHEVSGVLCAYPSEAVTVDLRPPIVIAGTMVKSLSEQPAQRLIAEFVPPGV